MLKFLSLSLLSLALPAFSHAADLVGATDRDLKITVQELRGVQESTKNNLYVKVTVERGTKNFSLFCSRRGSVKWLGSVNEIDCFDRAQTVSGDDDESFEFSITMETNADDEVSTNVEKIRYDGDGTFLGEKTEILTGMKWNDRRIGKLLIGLYPVHITPIAAFKQGETAIAALKELAGRPLTVPVRNADLQVPIESFTFEIRSDMTLDLGVALDTAEFQNVEVKTPANIELSLLKSAGKLNSGFRTAAAIRREVVRRYDIR